MVSTLTQSSATRRSAACGHRLHGIRATGEMSKLGRNSPHLPVRDYEEHVMTQPSTAAPGRITGALSHFLATLTYEQLPPAVVAAMKAMLLDSLGTTLAANTLGEGCRELVDVVRSAGGAPESTLIGFGVRVPALQAALA